MNKSAWKALFTLLVMSCLAVGLVGCGSKNEDPGIRRSRLIASENKQLQKDLAERDKQIKTLEKQHRDQIKALEAQLAEVQKQKETLDERLKQGIQEQVESVVETLMNQNVELRRQVMALEARLEELQP